MPKLEGSVVRLQIYQELVMQVTHVPGRSLKDPQMTGKAIELDIWYLELGFGTG